MTSSQPRQGRPAFPVAPDGWPKRIIFGNVSSFIRRTLPSHLNLSFIIAPESGIEPHFSKTEVMKLKTENWVMVPKKDKENSIADQEEKLKLVL